MDKLSRKILQNTMRFLSAKGYRVLSEFALPNKKRVDIIGINLKKEIVIVEVKSNKKLIVIDDNWYNLSNIEYGIPKFQEKILSLFKQ